MPNPAYQAQPKHSLGFVYLDEESQAYCTCHTIVGLIYLCPRSSGLYRGKHRKNVPNPATSRFQ